MDKEDILLKEEPSSLKAWQGIDKQKGGRNKISEFLVNLRS